MEKKLRPIKTCGNCRHLKIVKSGYEIENLLDSAYLISKCKIKGWQTKEYYLYVSHPLEIKGQEEECEFWEEWKLKKKKKKSRNFKKFGEIYKV